MSTDGVPDQGLEDLFDDYLYHFDLLESVLLKHKYVPTPEVVLSLRELMRMQEFLSAHVHDFHASMYPSEDVSILNCEPFLNENETGPSIADERVPCGAPVDSMQQVQVQFEDDITIGEQLAEGDFAEITRGVSTDDLRGGDPISANILDENDIADRLVKQIHDLIMHGSHTCVVASDAIVPSSIGYTVRTIVHCYNGLYESVCPIVFVPPSSGHIDIMHETYHINFIHVTSLRALEKALIGVRNSSLLIVVGTDKDLVDPASHAWMRARVEHELNLHVVILLAGDGDSACTEISDDLIVAHDSFVGRIANYVDAHGDSDFFSVDRIAISRHSLLM